MNYRAFALLTDAARGTELWRLALGLVLVALVSLGLSQSVFALASALLSPESYWSFVADLQGAASPASMYVLLFSVAGLGIGTVAAAQVLHGRGAASLFGPRIEALGQFMRVLIAVGILQIVIALLPPWTLYQGLQPGLPPARWLMLMPLTALALLVQTGSEELLFRGYLQSQLAARLPHPAVWLTVPSALFALGHYAPGVYGGNALVVTVWAFGFGLAAADLTARAGTLGPAIAMHLVNNVVSVAIIAPPDSMSGLALFVLPFPISDETSVRAVLPVDLATILLSWLAARIALRV